MGCFISKNREKKFNSHEKNSRYLTNCHLEESSILLKMPINSQLLKMPKMPDFIDKMAPSAEIESTTLRLGGARSVQLSYEGKYLIFKRTADNWDRAYSLIRRDLLYPFNYEEKDVIDVPR